MKKSAIVESILRIETHDELRELNEAVSMRWGELDSRALLDFKVGDRVEFTRTKSGQVIRGVVEKINRKTVSLKEDGKAYGYWRVDGACLRKID